MKNSFAHNYAAHVTVNYLPHSKFRCEQIVALFLCFINKLSPTLVKIFTDSTVTCFLFFFCFFHAIQLHEAFCVSYPCVLCTQMKETQYFSYFVLYCFNNLYLTSSFQHDKDDQIEKALHSRQMDCERKRALFWVTL